jgi:hypothetical protein
LSRKYVVLNSLNVAVDLQNFLCMSLISKRKFRQRVGGAIWNSPILLGGFLYEMQAKNVHSVGRTRRSQ